MAEIGNLPGTGILRVIYTYICVYIYIYSKQTKDKPNQKTQTKQQEQQTNKQQEQQTNNKNNKQTNNSNNNNKTEYHKQTITREADLLQRSFRLILSDHVSQTALVTVY